MRPRLPSLILFLKRRAPTSLYGRSLLIIVMPILVMQILVTWLFFDAYWQRVNSHMTEGLAGEIAWVIQGYETDPTPAGLKHLADRTTLTHLKLVGTAVTSAGLRELAGLTALVELDLQNTKVADFGLKNLKAMNKLKSLNLNGTNVTAAGVAVLQKELPQCNIVSDHTK